MKLSSLITFMYPFKFKDLICNSPFSLFCDFLRQLREFGALSSWHCQTDKLPILVIFFHGRGGGGVWLEMVSEVPYWLHMGVKEKHFYFYVNNSMQVFIALDMIYFFFILWFDCSAREAEDLGSSCSISHTTSSVWLSSIHKLTPSASGSTGSLKMIT